ncbi:MAG: glycosyltransferase family 9 protein [Alphaproteobacteria bacterium]
MTEALDVQRPRILVIKLGALGDFVQALAPMAAIRRHHPDAHLTLLTTAPFVELAEASRWFDDIWVDSRPDWWQPGGWLDLRRRLRTGRFQRVYDLQTSDRSGWYFRLMRRPLPGALRPEWSGIATGCSHPHSNPERDRMHTAERQREQLAMAGVPMNEPADLSWLDADVGRFPLTNGFFLLAPGGAAHRPEKRWPAQRYGAFARELANTGHQPVLIGGADEAEVMAAIRAKCPTALDLSGKTTLLDLAGLARRAAGAAGNDTGPMHVVAAVGCPSLVLYSHASDPALCGQRGPEVMVLRRRELKGLAVGEVEAAKRLR